MGRSIYVHVPFCASRCAYCGFYSGEDPSARGAYPALVEAEARLRARSFGGLGAPTLYVGGGTPSYLGTRLLCELVARVASVFPLEEGAQVTVEVNPESPPEWEELIGVGVNRVSVGVQALGDENLLLLGRPHDAASALEAIRGAVRAGLKVSADLMYGYAGLKAPDLAAWAGILAAEGVGHLSAYSLETLPGRPVPPSPEEEEEVQAELLADALEALGFVRYELSNFALPGQESRHNIAYWEGRSYLGLGPGAHSFLADETPHGLRFWNAPGLAAWAEALGRGELPPGEEERPTTEEAALERFFLTLRRSAPFAPETLLDSSNLPPLLDKLVEAGDLASLPGGRFIPTRSGLRRADGLANWLHENIFRRKSQ